MLVCSTIVVLRWTARRRRRDKIVQGLLMKYIGGVLFHLNKTIFLGIGFGQSLLFRSAILKPNLNSIEVETSSLSLSPSRQDLLSLAFRWDWATKRIRHARQWSDIVYHGISSPRPRAVRWWTAFVAFDSVCVYAMNRSSRWFSAVHCSEPCQWCSHRVTSLDVSWCYCCHRWMMGESIVNSHYSWNRSGNECWSPQVVYSFAMKVPSWGEWNKMRCNLGRLLRSARRLERKKRIGETIGLSIELRRRKSLIGGKRKKKKRLILGEQRGNSKLIPETDVWIFSRILLVDFSCRVNEPMFEWSAHLHRLDE